MLRSLLALLLAINIPAYSLDLVYPEKKKPWYSPDGFSAEYAGGFGLVSAGALYNGKSKSELGVTIGYVPNQFGNIWTTNILYSYNILPVRLNEYCELHLFKTGLFVNLNYGKNIYLSWPEKYPGNYYWWNSSIRFGPFIDTELKIKPSLKQLSYTIFFQCLTNDIYLYTYLPNTRFIRLTDIIYFGTGIKIHFGASSLIRKKHVQD